jgi:hypothetical protein
MSRVKLPTVPELRLCVIIDEKIRIGLYGKEK